MGEEFHSPREAAVHAGLTVIEDLSGGSVAALDGFGRRFLVQKTGNGPQAIHDGWATEDELRKWTPRHRPAQQHGFDSDQVHHIGPHSPEHLPQLD